ncbi:MAG TPA: hypothetical protein VGL13_03845, partial [Polyangiaceae bacterium]
TLFPAAAPITHHWLQKGLVWQDANRGLTIEPNGDLSWARATGITEAARLVPRGATALALALAAVGAPLWIAVKASGLRRSLVGIAVVAGAILAFHLVAAGRVSALWLALPPLGLVVDAAIRLRSRAWS